MKFSENLKIVAFSDGKKYNKIENKQKGNDNMKLSELYAPFRLERQQKRYEQIGKRFEEIFGSAPGTYFSAPGRSEICGNHTDHNMGKVMAAAIDVDIAAAVSPRDDGVIAVFSDNFPPIEVDISDLSVQRELFGTGEAIVRGIAAKMKEKGYEIGGFSAYNESDVLKGAGMSSSAAFEILICTIFSELYNDGRLSAVKAAEISKYAENVYFGKPSGLMDQMACSVGGFVKIDFENENHPGITPIPFDFAATGYRLILTDCHADHTDATDDYTSIRRDMAAVSAFFGQSNLRQVKETDFTDKIGEVRTECGDVAVLRAMHFFSENKLVNKAADALLLNDFATFKKCVISSGRSSQSYLQNIFSPSHPAEQALNVALCVSEKMLLPIGGAWRVHGGGFGGTVQAFVPMAVAEKYVAEMEKLFGQNCCYAVGIRSIGGTEVEL